jgi:hypothetical protein
MNAMDNNFMKNLGLVGMTFAGFGAREIAMKHPWSFFFGIPTLLGSMAVLASFYHSHQFTMDGRISLPNIAKVSLVATILVGFNVAYFDQGRPRPEMEFLVLVSDGF